MKTAVEWLEEQYLKRKGFLKTSDVNRAKEMEKVQIINAYIFAGGTNTDEEEKEAQQYYNETFKNKTNERRAIRIRRVNRYL